MLSTLQRRILKIAGYALFFLACFVAFAIWTFPVDRFAPRLERRLGEMLGREVAIGDASISLTGSLVLEAVEIGLSKDDGEPAPDPAALGAEAQPQAPAPKYFIEEIVIGVGFVDLLLGTLDLDVSAELLGGEISISYEGPLPNGEEEPVSGAAARRAALGRRGLRTGKGARDLAGAAGRAGAEATPAAPEGEGGDGADEATDEEDAEPIELVVEATGLELRQIHDLRRAAPIPVSGEIDFSIELRSETGLFAAAEGLMTVAARQIKVGDSKNPSEVGGMPVTVDEVVITELSWEIEVREGVGEIKRFDLKSQDFDARAEGSVAFADPFSRSRLDLYFTFKFLDAYTAKSPTAKLLVSSLPELSSSFRRALRTDGYFGFRYRGLLETAQFTPAKVFRGRAGRDGERPDRKARQRLSPTGNRRGIGGLDRGTPTDPTGGESPAATFPDQRPPMGQGPFGVDPIPPPTRPDSEPNEPPDRGAPADFSPLASPNRLGPDPGQVEEPQEAPVEQPQEEPPAGEQPVEEEQPEGENQDQEEVAPEEVQ